MELVTHLGRSSYNIKNNCLDLFTSVLAGNTIAYFVLDGKKYCPYFIAPWWEEPWLDIGADLLNVCRGNFFCLPMGGDPDAFSGSVIPVHGDCANGNWRFSCYKASGSSKSMEIDHINADGGKIHKEILLKDNETVIYETNTVSGYTGKYPVGYHPMIKLPDKPGQAHLAIGSYVDAYTTKYPHEEPANGGYYLLKSNTRISDITKVPTIYGDYEDLTSQPIRKGFEEVVIFISDSQENICYTAITNFEDGYIYFQLKNPKELQSTMLWISNGGRHYAPWNGRTTSVIGLEETTSFFHYGLKQSVQQNFLDQAGYKTFCEFDKSEEKSFKFASGIVRMPPSFAGVDSMSLSEGKIVFTDKNGLNAQTSFDTGFF